MIWYRNFPWDKPDGPLGCVYSFEHLKVASLAVADREELAYVEQDWQRLLDSLAHKVAVCATRIQVLDDALVAMHTAEDLPTAHRVANLLVAADWQYRTPSCVRPHVPATSGGLTINDIIGDGGASIDFKNIAGMAHGMRCAIIRLQLRWQRQLQCLQSMSMLDKHHMHAAKGIVPIVGDSLARLAALIVDHSI